MHVQWQLVLYETLELLLPPQLVYSTCASIYCCIQYIHLYLLSLHLVCIIYVSIVSTPGMIYVVSVVLNTLQCLQGFLLVIIIFDKFGYVMSIQMV